MTDKAQIALDFAAARPSPTSPRPTRTGGPRCRPCGSTFDGKPAFNTAAGRAKERNLRRDPRISLAIADPENPYAYVEVQGTATLEEGARRLHRRARQEVHRRGLLPVPQPAETRVTVLVEPERYWAGRPP